MTVVCMKKRMSGSRRIRRVIVAKKRMRMSDVCRQREVVGATHAATPLNGDGEVEAAQETSMEVPQDGESPMRRRVAVMVEPSPFSHVSGMRNRFLKLIEGLRAAGDEVLVFTPDEAAPSEWHGAKIVAVSGFPLPFYPSDTLRLSPGIDAGLWSSLDAFKADVLHVSSPGLMVFAGIALANLFNLPLVVSYHTHVPQYIPNYAWEGIVEPSQSMMWGVIRMCSESAALTLVTSSSMKKELESNGCKRVVVWQKGVDTDAFHPRFRNQDTRTKLLGSGSGSNNSSSSSTGGDIEQQAGGGGGGGKGGGGGDGVIIGYVGRLGSEKNIKALRDIMAMLPEDVRTRSTLVLVGDGPSRPELEEHFAGTHTVFTGMLHGEELSKAYASIDIFVMPSETETLGFVVLEAMASGVPVVAVAAGGLLDIIDESKGGGCMYEPGDYRRASELVAEIAGDTERRRAMGDAARMEVMAWGWQAATDKLRMGAYTRAIRRTRVKRIVKRLLRRLAPSFIVARVRETLLAVGGFFMHLAECMRSRLAAAASVTTAAALNVCARIRIAYAALYTK